MYCSRSTDMDSAAAGTRDNNCLESGQTRRFPIRAGSREKTQCAELHLCCALSCCESLLMFLLQHYAEPLLHNTLLNIHTDSTVPCLCSPQRPADHIKDSGRSHFWYKWCFVFDLSFILAPRGAQEVRFVPIYSWNGALQPTIYTLNGSTLTFCTCCSCAKTVSLCKRNIYRHFRCIHFQLYAFLTLVM